MKKAFVSHQDQWYVFCNVNFNSKADAQRTIDIELVNSNLAAIAISIYLRPMINIFTQNHKGGKTVLLKHPIEC